MQDPTEGGKRCDFCKWESLTAADTFGRVEMDTCVTASNLFKYCAPYHGLVLFKVCRLPRQVICASKGLMSIVSLKELGVGHLCRSTIPWSLTKRS